MRASRVAAAGGRPDVQVRRAQDPVVDRLYTDGEAPARQRLEAIWDRPGGAALWARLLRIARGSPLIQDR